MDKARTMVIASFAADALALGAHWIYDTRKIDEKYGRVRDFLKPLPPTYHPTKSAGDFTHYGDQTMVLLESLAAAGGFDAQAFSRAWREYFKTYTGYRDGATKLTLEHIAAGRAPLEAGSSSEDLAGAARLAPLVYCRREDPERLATDARLQTALTHNHPQVLAAAEFFARVAHRVLKGAPPRQAMTDTAAVVFDRQDPLAAWLEAGIASSAENTRSAIARFGQMCEVEAAFPATVHLIARYENRLEEALIENVMAGGDSAGRGMLAGMVLGAGAEPGALPQRWIKGLEALPRIGRLLDALDRAGGR